MSRADCIDCREIDHEAHVDDCSCPCHSYERELGSVEQSEQDAVYAVALFRISGHVTMTSMFWSNQYESRIKARAAAQEFALNEMKWHPDTLTARIVEITPSGSKQVL